MGRGHPMVGRKITDADSWGALGPKPRLTPAAVGPLAPGGFYRFGPRPELAKVRLPDAERCAL